jgi:hypothetical protein
LSRSAWRAGKGRRTRGIVTEPLIQSGQVQFVIEQVIQGMLEGAGEQLAGKIHGKELRAGIDSLVAGHFAIRSRKTSMRQSCSAYMTRAISHDAFLQPR